MASFFIPGLGDDLPAAEQAYGAMCAQVERDMGRRPNPDRIMLLWTRRGGADCVIEVGRRDPLHGGTALAIFDMGPHQPFVVWWHEAGEREGVREVLRSSAYSVLPFDP